VSDADEYLRVVLEVHFPNGWWADDIPEPVAEVMALVTSDPDGGDPQ
jgi:hypothetical protein